MSIKDFLGNPHFQAFAILLYKCYVLHDFVLNFQILEGMIMQEAICQGCGCIMDISEVEPFILCECENCGTELVIPLILGDLQMESEIGERGLFNVYKGYDSTRNSEVCICTLRKDIPDYDKWLKTANEEAVSIETLKHANICPLMRHGVAEDTFFATWPLMDGFDFTEYDPKVKGFLEIDNLIDMMQVIALAMGGAHHKEFQHHNLNLENIHIDARGNIRINNLYIERMRYLYESSSEKVKSSVSPYFISPEKAETGKEDKKGDVFSYGVMFYYMICGKYPFDGSNDPEIIFTRVKKKHVDEEKIFNTTRRIASPDLVEYKFPGKPCEIRAEVPEAISDLIIWCLSPFTTQRPRFPEVIDSINLYKAAVEQDKLEIAKRGIVRLPGEGGEITKTRALPLMKNLGEERKSQKKSKRKFFRMS